MDKHILPGYEVIAHLLNHCCLCFFFLILRVQYGWLNWDELCLFVVLKAYNLELEGMIKILKDENEQLKRQEVTIMSKHHLLLAM